MRTLLAAISTGCLLTAGCYDPTPPPPRASVPPTGTYTSISGAPSKPLPESATAEPARQTTSDVPQGNGSTGEEGAFVDIYQRVGSPRMTLFVNQSLQGPANAGSHVYLVPGQYDESAARQIDYDTIESVMTNALAAKGKTTMVLPQLTTTQVRGLQNLDPDVLKALGKDNDIDVLVEVQARPVQQTPQGLQIRLVGEAVNTAGGDTIARAAVDVPPPLDKSTLNDRTRSLARKLMSDMAHTWTSPRPQSAPPSNEPAPQPAPQQGPSAVPPGSPGQTPPAPMQPQALPPGAPTPVPPPAPLQPSTQPFSPPASTQPIG